MKNPIIRGIVWMVAFGLTTAAIAVFISPWASVAICLVAMASSFNFCRYCDKWGRNCECEPMNPEKDARNV